MMHQFSRNLKSKNIKQIMILMIFIMGNYNSIFACSSTYEPLMIDGEKALHEDSNAYIRQSVSLAISRRDVSTIMIPEEPISAESILTKDLSFPSTCISEIRENQSFYKPEYYDFLMKMIFETGLEDDRTQLNLGSFYEWIGNILHNNVKAEYWYIKSALQGNIQAQFNLGVFYERKETKLYDLVKAKYWYIQASNQGCYDAQYRLRVLSI